MMPGNPRDANSHPADMRLEGRVRPGWKFHPGCQLPGRKLNQFLAPPGGALYAAGFPPQSVRAISKTPGAPGSFFPKSYPFQ